MRKSKADVAKPRVVEAETHTSPLAAESIQPSHELLEQRLNALHAEKNFKRVAKEIFGIERLKPAQIETIQYIAWWDSLKMFTTTEFTILGEKVTGTALVSHYMKRNYTRTKGKNPILTDSKNLLNYLFDNKIVTDGY